VVTSSFSPLKCWREPRHDATVERGNERRKLGTQENDPSAPPPERDRAPRDSCSNSLLRETKESGCVTDRQQVDVVGIDLELRLSVSTCLMRRRSVCG
jgi:hypothetical protein